MAQKMCTVIAQTPVLSRGWLAGPDLVCIWVAKGGLAELKPKVQNVTSAHTL